MIGKHEIPVGYYCGPSALMALTGEPYEKVRTAINQAMGRRENAGIIRVKTEALAEAARFLGYEIKDTIRPLKSCPLSHLESVEGAWIIRTSGHFLAVFDGQVCENTHAWWLPIASSPSRFKRVTHGWRISNAKQ